MVSPETDGVGSAGGSRGTGQVQLARIQGSWRGSWEILDIQVRVIILSDRFFSEVKRARIKCNTLIVISFDYNAQY